MTDHVIEVDGFEKTFRVGVRRKRSVAARGISFTVEQGEIFGFLGPNGSGKTTTIKALLGLIRPDKGKLRLLGYEAEDLGWRSRVGYLPEHPTFYEYLTGLELVTWFGQLSGLARAEAEKEAHVLLERVGLGHALKKRLRTYSKGMLQRAGLAQALIRSPSLLILDEPMTGLDPIGRKDIREIILELRDEGKTVFYSTHILPDVEMTCDRVAMVNKGLTVRTGRLEDIVGETTRGVEVVLRDVGAELLGRLKAEHPNLTESQGAVEIQLSDELTARALVASALGAGATLEKLQPHRDDLESIFVRSLGAMGAEERA